MPEEKGKLLIYSHLLIFESGNDKPVILRYEVHAEQTAEQVAAIKADYAFRAELQQRLRRKHGKGKKSQMIRPFHVEFEEGESFNQIILDFDLFDDEAKPD